MEVTVKLATREGAAHISGILAGFILLARRGELTLRVQDERQGSPIAREALLETEIDGRTVVFDLMDGYFYNDPAAVLALFVLFYHRLFAITFDESFSRATGVKVGLYNTLLSVLTALTIVLGMRMMGAMLISSLVIFPALSAMRVLKSFRGVVICSGCISVASFCVGLTSSYLLGTPVGASVVLVDLAVFLVCCGIARVKKAN